MSMMQKLINDLESVKERLVDRKDKMIVDDAIDTIQVLGTKLSARNLNSGQDLHEETQPVELEEGYWVEVLGYNGRVYDEVLWSYSREDAEKYVENKARETIRENQDKYKYNGAIVFTRMYYICRIKNGGSKG